MEHLNTHRFDLPGSIRKARAFGSHVFELIDQVAGYVISMGPGVSMEDTFNRTHGGWLPRFQENARKKYNELTRDIAQILQLNPLVIRATPIVFPPESKHKSCGLMGGVQWSEYVCAISGLAGEHDRLIAALLVWILSGGDVWCEQGIRSVTLADGSHAKKVLVLKTHQDQMQQLLEFVSQVCATPQEFLPSGEVGIFARTNDIRELGEVFGFVLTV